MLVGLPWYNREDYPRILTIMADAKEQLYPTYKKWLRKAEELEGFLESQDHSTFRVTVDPDAFLAYCAASNLEPVSSTRSLYASDWVGALTDPDFEINPFAPYLTSSK